MNYDPNEPIPRGEYERRHEGLHRKYDTFSHRVGRTLAVFAVAILLTGGAAAWLIAQVTQQSDEISASLVRSCQTSGNPLRAATRQFGMTLIAQIRKDISQSSALDKSGQYAQFFPNIPPDELHELLEEQRKRDLATIGGLQAAVKNVAAVNCQEKFPK